ncbi:MAG TPA: SGNH/GDSL hydrolase family protein [Bacteroidales bacterium]|nr:SGNH/GDSL hydrolase family protein [Bacteroidales bacterium]
MSKNKKIIRIGVIVVYFILVFFHVALLLLGRSWVFSSLLFYSVLAIVSVWLIKLIFFGKKSKTSSVTKLKTIKYSIYITFLILAISDLGLRYITPKYRSYSERNNSIFYISPFSNGFRNLMTYIVYGTNTSKNGVYPANTSITYKTADFEYTHSFNEFGLRERKNIKSLAEGKKVILAIGDSFTEGVGTHQDSTWQRFLEQKLKKAGYGNYIVINAGISDTDPVSQLKIYETLQKEFNPEITVISIGSNDMLDIILKGGPEKLETRKDYLKAQPFQYYLFSWCYIFRAFSFVVYDNPEIFMNQQKFYGEIIKAEEIICTQIDKIKEKQISHNGKTIVFFFPDQNESLELHYKFKVFEQMIDKLKLQNDIYVFDMLDYDRSSQKTSKDIITSYYWTTDGHMKVSGYKLWAEVLFDKLINSKCLEENENK